MKNKTEWILPACWGLLIWIAIRMTDDMPSGNLFWERPMNITLAEMLSVVLLGYLHDCFIRKLYDYGQKRRTSGKYWNTLLEYLVWELYAAMSVVIAVFALHEYSNFDHTVQSYATALFMTLLCCTIIFFNLQNKKTGEKNRQQNIMLEKMKSENLNTQLQLLKSQYHPHFLFNMLNTVYFQIDESNVQARQTIQTVSELLRYQLYTIDEKVDVSQELAYLISYINLMKQRKSERLVLNTQFDETMAGRKIYPLLFQPLIENAFKYVGGDEPHIAISLVKAGDGLMFYVRNSIPAQEPPTKKGGIGIENLRKRLELLYPQQHVLQVNKDTKGFTVQLTLTTL